MDNSQSNDITSAFSSPTFGKDGSFFLDKPVGSMSISPSGRDIVLASRHGLHIVDLDSPWAPPRHLPHLTPWEVADVQWSPFASRDYWVVSTSNQKALVWNLAMSTPQASIEHILHAHNRAITDINFSAHHPDVLSTCAIDGFVHCWDLRHPARPAISFCDWAAGATQVKWNRQDPHIIASSHDKMLHIWDDRKGAYPLRSIEAHSTKIYGIDWNRTRSHGIVTCSLDKTVKFWDTSLSEDEPERIIRTPFPVWRARHTPFGWGVLAMPQRSSNNVYLYDRRLSEDSTRDSDTQPVREFDGHEDQVKEFLWRPRGSIENGIDNREFQLVTWGSDKHLRLHSLDDHDLAEVGYHKGSEVHRKLSFTRQNATYKTFREDPGHVPGLNAKGTTGANTAFFESDNGMEIYRAAVGTSIPSPSTADSGWMGGGFVNARSGHGKMGTRKDVDPIAWMKGVKIGKRGVLMDQSATSVASPHFRNDRSHEEFESLGEEITHIGSKFSKVEFSRIDVHKRVLEFSLYGPWGHKQSTTYLQCRIDFPKDYPSKSSPILSVEKTASLDVLTVNKLKDDVKAIADAFKACQRTSLEALFRFLQGEVSVEEATSWTKDDQEASVFDFADGDDNSDSDDEDDIEYPGTQNPEFSMTGSGVLSASIANANIPIPRTCGAVWSADGQLTCFFMPKDDKQTSLAGSLGLEGPSLLLKRRRRMYEGFGRVKKPSISVATKSKASSAGTMDSEDTDSDFESDSSDYSSSSSSVSSRGIDNKPHYFGPQHAFRTDVFDFPRAARPTDEADHSVASGSIVKSGSESTKSHLSVYNFESILPSKKALAERYQLSGSGACAHNSEVARAYGLFELADLWTMLDMLLREQVPLQTVPLNGDLNEASGIKILKPLRKHDSGVDLSADFMKGDGLTASVKWGHHPMGSAYLVQSLFEHFAQTADVQMLAMLSCLLTLPASDAVAVGLGPKQEVSELQSESGYTPALISPTGAVSTRTDYFPSIEVAVSALQPEKVLQADGGRLRTQPVSTASSLGANNSDPAGAMSSGLTPPVNFKSGRRSIDRLDTNSSQIFSSSPERTRWPQRQSSNLTSTIASSLPRPFSFTQSASSSPPNLSLKKRISPMGSFGTSQAQGTTWTAGGQYSRSMSTAEQGTTFGRSADARRLQKSRQLSASGTRKMSTRLKNQDKFLNDGYADVPFLNAEEEPTYQAYRTAYAELLSAWGLPYIKTEILKYNASARGRIWELDRATRSKSSHLLIGNKKSEHDALQNDRGKVCLSGVCAECESPQDLRRPIPTNKDRCSSCRARRTSQKCEFCSELIRGRTSPCAVCGHSLHSVCRSMVLETADAAEIGQCVAGCECVCSRYVEIEVDWPTEHSVAPASSAPSTIREVDEEPQSPAWEDVAYESLQKNLGASQSHAHRASIASRTKRYR